MSASDAKGVKHESGQPNWHEQQARQPTSAVDYSGSQWAKKRQQFNQPSPYEDQHPTLSPPQAATKRGSTARPHVRYYHVAIGQRQEITLGLNLALRTSPTETDCQPFHAAIFRLRLHRLTGSAISRGLIHEPGRTYKLEAHDRTATWILARDVSMRNDVLEDRLFAGR